MIFALAVLVIANLMIVSVGTSEAAAAKDRYVVMISIDGFAWEWYWKNPDVKIPTLRGLAAQGAVGPMEAAFPSVTWVSHTSLMTGAFPREHGALGNSILNRKTGATENLIGDAVFNKDDIVKVDTVYDIAKKQGGLKTAAIYWPLTRGSKNLDYLVPESYNQVVFEKVSKPAGFLDELRANGLPAGRWGPWSKLPESYRGDWLTAQTANYLIRTKKPNLMLVHFLVTDSFSHLYGAGSAEGKFAHEYVDGLVRSIVETLKAEGIFEKTTIFVVSDHGWTNITKAVKPNVLLKMHGLIRINKKEEIISKDAITVMNHGSAHVYVLNKARRPAILRDIKPKLAALEGVRVYGEKEFDHLGFPNPKDNPRMPDLWIEAKRGYFIINDHKGIGTIGKVNYVATHGHDPLPSWMKATLIVSGAGIKKGVKLDDVTVRDVTPTIVHLFGLKMPRTWPGRGGKFRKGRVLVEIFE
jgi:predicted AlkP superfamily pyrophosphatase or phosphodiesterase